MQFSEETGQVCSRDTCILLKTVSNNLAIKMFFSGFPLIMRNPELIDILVLFWDLFANNIETTVK